MRVRAARRIPFLLAVLGGLPLDAQIGREIAMPVHLQDGQEFTTPLKQLLKLASRCSRRTGLRMRAAGGR